MKFGAVLSAMALSVLMVGAAPVSASIVNLHTLPDSNVFWGNGNSNSNTLLSSTTTDTYNFKLSSTTGYSSLTVLDGFLGYSDVTLELFSGSGSSAVQLFPSVSGSDPLTLSDSGLSNGQYELKVIDTLAQATEEKIGRHEITFPSTGGYVLDFDVQTTSAPDPSTTNSVSGVPEPSTWAMMIFGFCGLALLAHRRRASAKLLYKLA